MTESVAELAAKVERIERSNRRLRGAVVALGLAWAAIFLMGQADRDDDVEELLEARALRIVDEDGAERVTIEADGVRYFSQDDVLGVHLGGDSDPTVTIFDPYDGESPIVTMDPSGVHFNDDDNGLQVNLGADDERTGLYLVQSGSIRAAFGVDDDRRSRLALNDLQSSVVVQSGTSDGGVAIFKQGFQRLSLGAVGDGSYGVFAFDHAQNPMLALASDEGGTNYMELRAARGQEAVLVYADWDPAKVEASQPEGARVPFTAGGSVFQTAGSEVPPAAEVTKSLDDTARLQVLEAGADPAPVDGP